MFWDVAVCHWVSGPDVSKEPNAYIFKCLASTVFQSNCVSLRCLCHALPSEYVSQECHSDVFQIILDMLPVFTVVAGVIIFCFVYHIVSLVTEGPFCFQAFFLLCNMAVYTCIIFSS
jgi:hypothetical protein